MTLSFILAGRSLLAGDDPPPPPAKAEASASAAAAPGSLPVAPPAAPVPIPTKPRPSAASPKPPPPPPTFAVDVAPLLARWCVGCHGGREPEANLRLDDYESLLAGGDSGPPVVARDPVASLIVAKVERRDRPAMPPRKRLPRAAVSTLRAWVAAGALP